MVEQFDVCTEICGKFWREGEAEPCPRCHPTRRALMALLARPPAPLHPEPSMQPPQQPQPPVSASSPTPADSHNQGATELIVLSNSKNTIDRALENLTWDCVNQIIETLEAGPFSEDQIKDIELVLIEAKKRGIQKS
ncbi:MAG TPA: hypothetical protein ENH13_01320 [Euryarchaeota archaeon]|nr:hypothetical protein [Euryarchaeota archaeon]